MKASQNNCSGRICLGGILLVLAFLSFFPAYSFAVLWRRISDGLYLGEFRPKIKSSLCNQKIVILKINPRHYSLNLLSATEHGRKARTGKRWSEKFGLVAAINASMYQATDLLKSTGYMKNFRHYNNSHINPGYGAFLVFNPRSPSLPPVQIVDSRLQKNWKNIIKKYNSVVQNYRMISHGKRTRWPERSKKHGIVCIATDRDNNVLFVLSRSPFSTHDFIQILLALPVNIKNASYLEGGPEANLYLKTHDTEMNLIGSCVGNLAGQNTETSSLKLPNVLGIMRRK